MKVIFAGTPEFAAVALQALLDNGYDVPLVLTQPDRPAGRGMKLQASAVKQVAQAHGLLVAQPRSLRLDGAYSQEALAAQTLIQAAQADFMVVAAYGLLLPQWTLNAPRHGCLNIHASLLPRWRGAAPIHRAIEAGDTQTGITIMQMDAGLDTGAMLLSQAVPIIHTGALADTTQTLHDRLAPVGASLIQQALQRYTDLQPTPQDTLGVTYAAKVTKAESVIDWTQTAQAIEQKIRAFDPAPGCTTLLNGEMVKVWRATSNLESITSNTTGARLDASDVLRFETATSPLYVTQLQRPGGKRMSAFDYLRGLRSRG